MRQNTFEKNERVEMLMNVIIESELRRPVLSGLTCAPITGYFYDKTKIFKENLRVDYCLLL